MIAFFTVLTLLCMFLCVYVYVGYPVLLMILKVVWPTKKVQKADITPNITFIVSCYNEVDVIRQKIENCLAIDYPQDKIQFIFISDGSDDGTDEVVSEFANERLILVRQEGRLGKTSGLNLGMKHATGEVVVFSDANAMYHTDAVRKLVRSFNDPTVGYVVGAALYVDVDKSSAAQSEDAYWQYEIRLKTIESDLHSVVGGDGAIYAIRRELYDDLDRKDINDFVNPLQIIAKGYRGIFEPEAICDEEAAGTFDKEARRKERIVNRSFRGLMKVKAVMNPFRTGIFSLEIISHKLLRWLIPFFLIGTALGSVVLSFADVFIFQVLVVLEVLFFWLAILGYMRSSAEKLPALLYYPYYFLMVNFYSMKGVFKALQGDIQVTWSSPRQKVDGSTIVNWREYGVIAALFLLSGGLLFSVIQGLLH